MLPMLKEDIMTNVDYEKLKEGIIDQMIAKSKAMTKKKKSSDQDQCNPPATTSLPYSNEEKSKKHRKASQMLRGLNTKPKASTDEIAENDDELRDYCMAKLIRYINDALAGIFPIQDDDKLHSDPLEWRKNNVVKCELISHLDRLHLVITAASAPSERI